MITGRNFGCVLHRPKAKAKGTTIAAAEPFELGGQR